MLICTQLVRLNKLTQLLLLHQVDDLDFIHQKVRKFVLPGDLPGAAAPVPEDPQKHVRP